MPKRVLIQGGQAAAIQVSLPGFDVTTATLDQMAFDARFGHLRLLMNGVIYIPYNTYQTVSYGTTLSRIPRVVACFEQAAIQASAVAPNGNLPTGSAYNSLQQVEATASYVNFGSFSNIPGDPASEAYAANAYVYYAIYY